MYDEKYTITIRLEKLYKKKCLIFVFMLQILSYITITLNEI